ncbi:hypothetical protein DPQ33_04295 [Oceanidesulfovibrio indonesiensis]|uniref:protein-glutamate O-methyltransferase n=1 Tax=Oceanidesulfovibrio indonesiensis TaxID=54767 RepID=A0A7M3MH22_9BACT|nr:CheR family methyltransferase [Oceanidesulfovibrio indonesiensis]TVM18702.1 hypothetical protein DPQ33_04295 [Oceanidesulfovibrio indonesiensis]
MADRKKQDEAQKKTAQEQEERQPEKADAGGGSSGEVEKERTSKPQSGSSPRVQSKHMGQASSLLLVGIGASAGGLDPIFQVVEQLDPDDPGAYFVVQHQAMQTGEDLLSSLLSKRSECDVKLARQDMTVEPGVIYVAPPDKLLSFHNMRLRLDDKPVRNKPIDHLLRSLADTAGERSMAVILSGSDTDGTLGARAVMESGGVVIAQEPETAEYTTMPQSIIDNNLADLMLPPDNIAEYIQEFAQKLGSRDSAENTVDLPQKLREELLEEVKDRAGHDFTDYKENTINRRIRRRMDFNKIERPKDYVAFVKARPDEAQELFKDMLISVTNFFRDPACFEALKQALVKDYLPRKNSNEFRAWVPGCATGEEAYTLAIILAEAMAEADVHCEVSIYATDVDAQAIASARKGVFPENIESDVSEQRLRRFFTHQNNQYKIKQKIRDMLIFAEQNVRQDPPFYRLDAIVCRNLLMYFKPEAQQKVLSHFCYALKRNGLLMLGTSESVGQYNDCLRSLDSHCRLYAAKRGIEDNSRDFGGHSSRIFSMTGIRGGRQERSRPEDIGEDGGIRSMERILLKLATPPSAIVNRQGDIHYLHGRTGKLLEPAQGKPDANILRMAREGLRMDLATLLSECAHSQQVQRRRNVRVRTNGDEEFFDIAIHPVNSDQFETPMFLIEFRESDEPSEGALELPDMDGVAETVKRRIAILESEVQECRDSMRIMTEEYEAANEELKSSNEELQSTNEELKSTVEELETAKEEVQSINEEQATLNDELQSKNSELQRISSDLDNLLVSTEIATLFLNADLEIRRYTPAMTELMSLRESDVGRPVTDIAMKLDYADLSRDAARVQETLKPIARELESDNNTWLQMRIRPYRTTDNRIDGVVVTFNDITQLKRSERTSRSAQSLAESIIEISSAPILVLDENLVIQSTNRAFLDIFGVTEKRTLGKRISEVAHGRLDVPALTNALGRLVKEKEVLRNHAVEAEVEPSRRVRLFINAKYVPFSTMEGEARRILMSIADIKPLNEEG